MGEKPIAGRGHDHGVVCRYEVYRGNVVIASFWLFRDAERFVASRDDCKKLDIGILRGAV